MATPRETANRIGESILLTWLHLHVFMLHFFLFFEGVSIIIIIWNIIPCFPSFCDLFVLGFSTSSESVSTVIIYYFVWVFLLLF